MKEIFKESGKLIYKVITLIIVLVGLIYILIKQEAVNMEEKKNAQTEANKKWQEQNREKARYLRNRSTARSFIKKQATLEDIQELEQLIAGRKSEL